MSRQEKFIRIRITPVSRPEDRPAEQKALVVVPHTAAEALLQQARQEANRLLQEAGRRARAMEEQARQEGMEEARRCCAQAWEELQDREEALQKQQEKLKDQEAKQYRRQLALNTREQSIRRTMERPELAAQLDALQRELSYTALQRETDTAQALEEARRQMTEQANLLRRQARDDWQQTLGQLQQLQNELYEELDCWQRELQQQELYPLADCLIQMTRILEGNPALQPDAVEGQPALASLRASLQVYLGLLEKALARLGLHVCSPQPGSEYDDLFQIPAPGSRPGPRARVVRCLRPGVFQSVDGDPDNGEPLIRAVVELEEGGC